MNTAQLKAVRELWASNSPNENYCLKDKNKRMIIGWITKKRAEEYQQYYENSTIELMPI